MRVSLFDSDPKLTSRRFFCFPSALSLLLGDGFPGVLSGDFTGTVLDGQTVSVADSTGSVAACFKRIRSSQDV